MSSGAETDDPLNLTGVWHGQFSYPRAIEPTPFTATLSDNDGWLTGATEEIARVGPIEGRPIAATVQGRRSGHSVTFLKIYDNPPAGYDAVQYAGDVNRDGSEIEGRWTIPGVWSGKLSPACSGCLPEIDQLALVVWRAWAAFDWSSCPDVCWAMAPDVTPIASSDAAKGSLRRIDRSLPTNGFNAVPSSEAVRPTDIKCMLGPPIQQRRIGICRDSCKPAGHRPQKGSRRTPAEAGATKAFRNVRRRRCRPRPDHRP
jgi:hypothetical protein